MTDWIGTPANFAVNSLTDVTIVTRDVTVSAGQQVIFDVWFRILNDGSSNRTYTITLDFGAAFDIEFATGSQSNSSTAQVPYHCIGVLDVRSNSLAYCVIQGEEQLAAGLASGADTAMAATHLTGMGWGSTASDLTGTVTCTMKVRSDGNETTQTLYLDMAVIDIPAVVGGATYVAVGQASEADSGQAIAWSPKNRLLGQTSETDQAQTIARVTTVSVGQTSETDLAQALAARKAKAIGQANEADLSQAIGRLKTKATGQATETDLAQPFSWRKTATIGQVIETDLAQAAGRTKTKALGQTTEADLAQAITRLGATVIAVGQAFETDTAQTISWAPKRRLVAQASEVNIAQAITGPAPPPPPPATEARGGSGVSFRMRRERQLEILKQEEEELLLLLL